MFIKCLQGFAKYAEFRGMNDGVKMSFAPVHSVSVCWVGGEMCECPERKESSSLQSGFAQFPSSARMWVSVHSSPDSLCSCVVAEWMRYTAESNGGIIMICIEGGNFEIKYGKRLCPLQFGPGMGPWVIIICSFCSVALIGILYSEGNGMTYQLGLLWIETVSGKR